MSSREARKTALRTARIESHARAQHQAARRKRLRSLLVVLGFAVAAVALSVAVSSGNSRSNAASGGKLVGASLSRRLFAGIPQRGDVLGDRRAPVRLIEFADLQCPYCDEYTLQALPPLVNDYVRTGKLQMQFENLSFIGPGSVAAGRAAAAAAQQDKLWNFVDLVYLNQGEENSGYVTPAYLRGLLAAVPGLNVAKALAASRTATAAEALTRANDTSAQYGVDATPSFLIGRSGGPLRQFQPSTLDAAPFQAEIDSVLGRSR
jgi:protein-disulfide isomerase